MNLIKRFLVFGAVNILVVVTLSVTLSILGVQSYLQANGIDYTSLLIFCTIWGFGGAFISLALSKVMAKWMMGVRVVDPKTSDPELRRLVERVHRFARQAGIEGLPEVGIYNSPEINAFATGPTRNRSLVAVSSGLLSAMNDQEVDGVLAHEVAHIANGDMVTMTLVQGVVNVFVMFLARIIAFFASQFVDEEKRGLVHFVVVIALDMLLGIFGMIVVAYVSRRREYRADGGGATLAGSGAMIAALERLSANRHIRIQTDEPALASLKIYGKSGGFLKLFATHPDLDDRIRRLKAR